MAKTKNLKNCMCIFLLERFLNVKYFCKKKLTKTEKQKDILDENKYHKSNI